MNRAASLGHEPLLRFSQDRIVFRMQHTQHPCRAGCLEDFEPGQSVKVERLPGEKVFAGAHEASTREVLEQVWRESSGIVPDGDMDEEVGHR